MAATPQQTSASLYVGDLHPDVNEPDLHRHFHQVGPIASIRLCRDALTRRSLGYAYVNFFKTEDAERALDVLNYTEINGKQIRIMWCHRDPSVRRSGVGNVFIKNLHDDIGNRELFDTFSEFGNILSCKVVVDENGKSRGYGFVHFETQDAADKAIQSVNDKEMLGKIVKVTMWRSRRDRARATMSNFTNLYVKNLPAEFTTEKLTEIFAPYGAITSARIMAKDDGASKGFGFVNFEQHESAVAAVEALNGKEVAEGKQLYVSRAQKKSERRVELLAKFQTPTFGGLPQGTNLYVKNLDESVDEARLREEFNQFGNITSVKVMRSDDNSTSRGFGFVSFSSPEEATAALTHMSGKLVANKPLYVALAQKKNERRAQLEAQRAQSQHAILAGMPQGMNPAPMYSAMFYPGQGVPGPQMYAAAATAPMIRRPWQSGEPYPQGGAGGAPAGGAPGAGYAGGVRNAAPGGPGAGGRGPRPQTGGPRGAGGAPRVGGAAGGRGGRQGAYQFNQNARNRDQPQQGAQNPYGTLPAQPDLSSLAAASPDERRQILGERLYPLVLSQCGDKGNLAPKVTGMLLQMEPQDVLLLLESPSDLSNKVAEAIGLIEYSAANAAPAESETPGAPIAETA